METFILILSIVWSILCLVLFFKIWGMTNDVKKILETITPKQEYATPTDVVRPKNVAKDKCILIKGDAIATDLGNFSYYGIYDGKHALYPNDKETEDRISKDPKAIKDSLSALYLGLSDSELEEMVNKK